MTTPVYYDSRQRARRWPSRPLDAGVRTTSLLVLALAAVLASPAVAPAALVGYWKFDAADPLGTSTDYAGGDHDGTFNGGAEAAIVTDGTRGDVLSLNPSSPTTEGGYIATPSITSVGNTTWSAWVYLRSETNATGGYPMFMTSGGGAYEFRFFSTTRRPEIINGGNIAQSPTALALNSWHQITHTGSGTSFVLYVDGNQVATGTGTAWPGGVVNFGHRVGDGHYLNGQLDDIQIWNEALSSGKVKSLVEPVLDYDALQMGQLFSVFDAEGVATVNINGRDWSYVTGLTLGEGESLVDGGLAYLQLDGSGNGLFGLPQVPEPSSFALLGLGGLPMASRKRRRK